MAHAAQTRGLTLGHGEQGLAIVVPLFNEANNLVALQELIWPD